MAMSRMLALLSLALSLAWASPLVVGDAALDSDGGIFPGWNGEQSASGGTAGGARGRTPREYVRMLSWQPRVVEHHGFLTASECDEIVSAARLAAGAPGALDGAEGVELPLLALGGAARAAVQRADEQAARLSMSPEANGAAWRVRRLTRNSDDSEAHLDTIEGLEPGKWLPRGGQVTAVLLAYLSDAPAGGGETVLPDAKLKQAPWRRDKGVRWSKCASNSKQMALPPTKGDAHLLWALDNALRPDPLAKRKTCAPMGDGEVWVATKVLYTNPLDVAPDAA